MVRDPKAVAAAGLAVYRLADCPECKTKYAVVPDTLGGWFYYRAVTPVGTPLAQTAGGIPDGILLGASTPFCMQCGVDLATKHEHAVLSAHGDWLKLSPPPPPMITHLPRNR